jgi:hypothetical protein
MCDLLLPYHLEDRGSKLHRNIGVTIWTTAGSFESGRRSSKVKGSAQQHARTGTWCLPICQAQGTESGQCYLSVSWVCCQLIALNGRPMRHQTSNPTMNCKWERISKSGTLRVHILYNNINNSKISVPWKALPVRIRQLYICYMFAKGISFNKAICCRNARSCRIHCFQSAIAQNF